MRYGSVCSGIEAVTSAWHDLGWKPSFFSEIEAFPRAVLKHHYPETALHGDFTTIKGNEYEPIDILVGGTPCQSFSIAGLRGGLADDRGNLALEFLRLADRTRPRWLVWENVPGVLSSNGGRDFGSILGGMVERGYGIAYRILDAQYFGVAQRRRRVFVVGYLGDWRRAAAVLFERHSLSGNPAPRREAGQRPAPTISARPTGGGGLGTDFDCDGGMISMAHGQGGAEIGFDCGPTLTCNHEAPIVAGSLLAGGRTNNPLDQTLIAHTLRGEGFDASEDGTGRGTPLVPVTAPTLTSNGDAHSEYRDEHGLIPITYSIMPQNSGKDYVVQSPTTFGGDVARTLSARYDSSPCADRGQDVVAIKMQVRRLTPKECERLQGFPDDYTAIPWRGKPADQCPDGLRYKALGNSMAVPVMRWIGKRIQAVEQILNETEGSD